MDMIEILEASPGTTVQDLGRTGYAIWGIRPSGAADQASIRLANRLVGNLESAACFEVLLGGLTIRSTSGIFIAVTGAPGTLLLDGAREVGIDGPQWIPAGATLTVATPREQLRSYVAVRGGLHTDEVLGSRSVDVPSGIGRALRAGDIIPVGGPAVGLPLIDHAPRARWPTGPLELHGVIGPRAEWFTPTALSTLISHAYTVTPATDRIGTRLAGPTLHRAITRELFSEPTIRGAVEVPTDGLPIVFGADHPTTCGYPVIAVLDPASADRLSQCRPGQAVAFHLRPPEIRISTAPNGSGGLAP